MITKNREYSIVLCCGAQKLILLWECWIITVEQMAKKLLGGSPRTAESLHSWNWLSFRYTLLKSWANMERSRWTIWICLIGARFDTRRQTRGFSYENPIRPYECTFVDGYIIRNSLINAAGAEMIMFNLRSNGVEITWAFCGLFAVALPQVLRYCSP